ncbi:hypothetical protein Kpol_1032p20 [Vanderwaltozyma polyspora DSM 70294]|uniref:Kinetochore protein Nuf2 N-terminal domain-containing protein n=1 Tax=Vanderwaltozyma polyspora (strain ATCC 22028 / DSM 70294 / BCRC 21397 / CBS 2163 / NBRC 10782 / NRRL Y-8283 / UCD 57-17) TaxID=436907 RepID=A7TGX5_VANPO|nr:uncharacterized protein Kpol_1032p20 [Vanderwaltozyma polyspora DSM 70294]EDO18427.1 hypothetical protein Kpol_1032p20 [Vanderwaltozyma polyspora DSM 70294]
MSVYTFPILEVPEIVEMLQKCDFSLAAEDKITRPSSEYVITLYKQIIESYMGLSTDYLMSVGTNSSLVGEEGQFGGNFQQHNSDIDGDDGVYKETLQVLVLNKICYKFFQNIGVNDFNIMDLYKPDSQRTKRLLSAVVNYARFRGERIEDCTEIIERSEQLLNQLLSKFDRYNVLHKMAKQYQEGTDFENIDLNDTSGNNDLNKLEEENRKLESQLKRLTQVQETLTIDYNNYKKEKQNMLTELETLGFQQIELESQKSKLEKYVNTDMNELSKAIVELTELLSKREDQRKELENRQQNLIISVQTLQKVIEDLYDVIRLLSTELQETHRNEVDILDFKKQLSMRRDKMQEVLSTGIMYKLSLLQEQYQTQKEKLNELKTTTESQSQANEERINELSKQYTEELIPKLRQQEERIEIDLIAGVVGKLENEISNMQAEFQKEVDAIELEYSLLVTHINQYMERMLQEM